MATTTETQILWKGASVHIEFDQHIKVVAEAPLGTLSDDAILEFENVIGKMQHVFQKVFGHGDFTRWMPLNPGIPITKVTNLQAYLLPARAYSKSNQIDMELKVKQMLFMLYESERDLPCMDPCHFQQIATQINEVFSQELPSIEIQEESLQNINFQEGFDLLKANISDYDDSMSLEKIDKIVTLRKECGVFCSPTVREKQLVKKGAHILILGYPRPYADSHFTVIPKRHITTISDQSKNEVLESYAAYRNIAEGRKIGVMTRIGPRAGQTQSHLHHHIIEYNPFFIQSWHKNWLHQLSASAPYREALAASDYTILRRNWSNLI